MGGRRTTPRTKEAFLDAYSRGWNITKACQACAISRRTFYTWCEHDPEFRQRVDDAKEGLLDMAESLLMRNMSEGDTASIIFFLKTQGRERGYEERRRVDVASAEAEVVIPDTLKELD